MKTYPLLAYLGNFDHDWGWVGSQKISNLNMGWVKSMPGDFGEVGLVINFLAFGTPFVSCHIRYIRIYTLYFLCPGANKKSGQIQFSIFDLSGLTFRAHLGPHWSLQLDTSGPETSRKSTNHSLRRP